MKEGWKDICLNDISKTQYGYTASATLDNTGVKFLRITDIVPEFINWDSIPFCQISPKEKEKYLLKKGDIVVARTGATVGYAKLINQDNIDSVFASYLVKIDLDETVDKIYIGKIIESNIYKDYIQTIAGGSAQPNANANDLTSFKIKVPELKIQQRIASILSAYDDLIEVNNKRIELLEQSARELYKEWFVRMRFPNYQNTKFNKGVPEGWEEKRLEEIVNITSSKRIFQSEYSEEGVPFYRGKEISMLSKGENINDLLYISNEKYCDIEKKFGVPKEGDILITAVGTIGNVYRVDNHKFYFKDGNLIWLQLDSDYIS
ncbi:MAG: restriction endonuclease subunit S, partial [Odoribacter sp.]|nr:restriction endonuclease subunit S [Odoribacter sp.]